MTCKDKYTKICPNCGCRMASRFECELYCENCGRRETIFGSVLYKGRRMDPTSVRRRIIK